MRPLALDEMVGIDAYEALRDDYRARVVAHKKSRRLPVGDRVTLVFEDRETIRFQVQEMMRVERLRAPEKVQHELDVYNELIPGDGELSATLLIEITEIGSIRAELDRLIGLDEHVFLIVGEGADAARVQARFDEKQLDDERIAAVQYVRFVVPESLRERLRDFSVPAWVAIEQESYHQRVPLPEDVRSALLGDLIGDPDPLLRPPPGGGALESSDPVLFESERVRARRPVHPAGPGHVVVEPLEPLDSWLAADDALSTELLAVVRRFAAEVQAQHGRCRVVTDLHAWGARWHVFAVEG